MTREEIVKSYNVDSKGLIRSPGKFEGEMCYVPYYWDMFLNGCADKDDGKYLIFYVIKRDRAAFPELKGRRVVKLTEDINGFVVEV